MNTHREDARAAATELKEAYADMMATNAEAMASEKEWTPEFKERLQATQRRYEVARSARHETRHPT